jgi:hypothetical protein
MSKKKKGDEKVMPADWRYVPGVPNAGLEACDGPVPYAEWVRRFGNLRQPIRPGFLARGPKSGAMSARQPEGAPTPAKRGEQDGPKEK